MAAEIPAPVGPILGTAYTVAKDALAITAAAAAAASVLSSSAAESPSAQITRPAAFPLYRQGQPAGIEIEGGEVILTRKVTDNPLLLSLASFVNQQPGGRALVASSVRPHLAGGGVANPLVQQQLTGNVSSVSPAAIGRR